MKVSIVIPAYNEEKIIKKALDSVINQVEAAEEIIVVDNNSTDKTAEIAKKLGVKVVREEKQGMTPARNRGFNTAKYDIIARIDADVVVPPDWVKRIRKNFETKRIDALSGPLILADAPEIISKTPFPSKLYLDSLRMLSKGKRYLMGPNMSLTNDIWVHVRDIVNMDDSKVHEDIDLSLKILKIGGIIGYDKKLIVNGSVRRMIKNPKSFFIEYPKRMITTFRENKKSSI